MLGKNSDLFYKSAQMGYDIGMISNEKIRESAYIFCPYLTSERAEYYKKELVNLASSAMLDIRGTDFCVLREITSATYIGSGKLQEIKDKVDALDVDLVIFDATLTGSQIRNIENALECRVIDRNMLILDIFATRAQSNEGKLQVELAQMKYLKPRLSSIVGSNGRFGGGVGMRGPGETKLETDRRRIEDSIAKKEKELLLVKKHRQESRKQRQRNTKTVAMVGYTNSGKTTLLNTITKAQGYADDRLFATLDVLTRKVWDEGVSYVLADTVGFVSNLPHELTHAFSATLEESTDADLLLVVADASDDQVSDQLRVVFDVLDGLHCDKAKMLLVYNKIDKLPTVQHLATFDGIDTVYISAKMNRNIDTLKSKIRTKLTSQH